MSIFALRKFKKIHPQPGCTIEMETLKFKTNIKCGACVATVTPFLDGDENVSKWNVDLQNADRILQVATSSSPSEIEQLIKKAGYSAEEIA